MSRIVVQGKNLLSHSRRHIGLFNCILRTDHIQNVKRRNWSAAERSGDERWWVSTLPFHFDICPSFVDTKRELVHAKKKYDTIPIVVHRNLFGSKVYHVYVRTLRNSEIVSKPRVNGQGHTKTHAQWSPAKAATNLTTATTECWVEICVVFFFFGNHSALKIHLTFSPKSHTTTYDVRLLFFFFYIEHIFS